MKSILLPLIVALLLSGCYSAIDLYGEFYFAKLSNRIDAKKTKGKEIWLSVDNTWYEVPINHYGALYRYVAIGDSLFKEANQWDLIVKHRENGNFVEQYFLGAKGEWD